MFIKGVRGVTLIEILVFIIAVSIALVALLSVFNASVISSVDPLVRVRALTLAQAQLDEILARKFDENTPTGGVPACDTTAGIPCAGIIADSDYDDVGDFHNYVNNSHANYPVSVSVQNAGADLGLPAAQARLITVTVGMPGGDALRLAAYKVNF